MFSLLLPAASNVFVANIPWGLKLGSKLDGSPSCAHGNSYRCCLETLAPVGWRFCLPIAYPASKSVVFWLGIGVRNLSVWPDCGVGSGRPEPPRLASATVELVPSWRRFLACFQKNSKAAIAKWKDDMKNRGLAARWVDLQHHVNWADARSL